MPDNPLAFGRRMLGKMNERLEQIRKLLGELEIDMRSGAPKGDRDFSALELPLIIQQVVDDLQPQLTPYDAAFYWFLFRHSIAKDGDPHSRVSTRQLRTAVVKSSYSQLEENPISLGKVQETLRALESIGAIRKEGEPNRDGTLYRVLIPDEMEACRRYRAERVAAEPELKFRFSGGDEDPKRENRIKVFERDGYVCRYCGKQLTRLTATTRQVESIDEGGDHSIENIVTACLECNSRESGHARRDSRES